MTTFRHYVSFQWRLFWHNPKNLAVLLIAVCASLIFTFKTAPSFQPIQKVDPVAIETSRLGHEDYLKDYHQMAAEHSVYTSSLAGAVPVYQYFVKRESASLKAIQSRNWAGYAKAQRSWLHLLDYLIWGRHASPFAYFYPEQYYGQKGQNYDDPNGAGHYWNNETQTRFAANAKDPRTTKSVIETRTAAQTIQRLMTDSGFFAVILAAALLLGNDSITRDRKHKSLLANLPLTPWQELGGKFIAVFAGFWSICLLCFAIVFIGLGIQFGTGLTAPLAIYGAKGFYTISGFKYLLMLAGVLIFFSGFFIRLIALLQILLRNEYAALAAAGALLFAERFYWTQGFSLIFPKLTWLPTNFFNAGRLLSGYQIYRYSSANLNLKNGLLIVGTCWLVVELLLAIISHAKHFQLVV